MKSSMGMAGKVWSLTLPLEDNSADTLAMVSLLGASTTLTKSYRPNVAY